MIVASSNPFTTLEHILRHILDWLHGTIGLPWSWSIVALTVLVRMVLVPLTVRQIHSMQALQAHAPQMKEIQRKYKGDRPKLNEELMKFYKENQINPAASCLPMLAQIPVFIGLYYTLRHFTKHVPPHSNLSWLHVVPDITKHANAHWSGYLLLAVYAISQTSSTLLMSSTMDKTQRMLLLIMPLIFITFLARFPVGLLLYWVTTNLWTVGQGVVTRQLVPKGPVAPPKRSSRTPPREEAAADGATAAAAQAPQPKPAAAGPPRRVKRKKKKRTRR